MWLVLQVTVSARVKLPSVVLKTITTGVMDGVTLPVGFNSPVSRSISNSTIVSPF
jgi:hypothetical protein